MESYFGRPGDIDFVGDVDILWGQTQFAVIARPGDATFDHGLGFDDVIGVVDRGGGCGRNGPLIARHERNLGPVHRCFLAFERLVHVGGGARLHRPARR